jgi:alanyl-tRNA synthetase
MTTRLYYADSYQTTFDAVVADCVERDGRIEVTLDRTAFYPTSGGQPFDIGTLGDARVVDVVDASDGRVVHVVDRPLAPASSVRGAIDWDRRFDHMQQHTGQHVLSAAFDGLFGVRTESFHLGTASASIDLARQVSADEIRAAEDEANRIVWEDRPVAVRTVSAEEAAALPLRKESARTGPLRLIDIERFDLSACGGTHVRSTGAIGVIAIPGSEKFRAGTRVEFLCGRRALQRFRHWRDALAATGRHLSVTPAELPAAVERLQADAKSATRTIRGLQEQLAVHVAQTLIERGVRSGGRIVVAEAVEGWDAAGLKAIAAATIASAPAALVALFSQSTPLVGVIASGRDAGADAAAILRALTTRFGGKGGGKPDLAQGGGWSASPADLIAEVKRTLEP